MYWELEDFDQARATMQQALTALRADGDQQDLARSLTQEAEFCLHLGDLDAVRPLLEEAVQRAARLDAHRILFTGQVLTARLVAARGDLAHAVEQLTALLEPYGLEEEQAEVYYWLWKIQGGRTHRQKAIDKNSALLEGVPLAIYRKRLVELGHSEP
jgi:tetratricopeptide (TPR) repeat protein